MRQFVKLAAVAAIVVLYAPTVPAGTTGKIAGKVTDAETGEPLPGANIVIEGTNLGAASDLNGNYTILNVPPGVYSVRFRFIGYAEVIVQNVRVNVDFTTRLDRALKPSAVQVGEIEVVAERNPLVRQDLTNTQYAVTAETINELPVDRLEEVIQLQAGIIADNSGELHIRGGRSNEIAFQINGVSIDNPFNNQQAVGIATNAVQEVSISAGTFSAQYGNALSGVINYVTKEGGNNYAATLRAWTGDHATGKSDVFFGIDQFDAFNNSRVEGTLGGPVPGFGRNFRFFLSGVYQKDKSYLYGIDLYRPQDILILEGDTFVFDPFGDGEPSGSGEIVPMQVRDTYNFTSKLSYNFSPRFKLSYDVIFDYAKRPSGGQFRNFRFNPEGRATLRTTNQSHSIGITHTLSNNTFYTLKFSGNFTLAKNWVFDDPNDPRYQASFSGEVSNNLFPQTDYLAGGHNLGRGRDETRSYIGKLDVVSQVSPVHELRFGGEVVQHRLERESYTLLHTDLTGNSPPIIPYPELNPAFTSYQYYVRHPVQGALYVLDKMELARSFILNIGLRYEYLYTNALYNPDLIGTADTGVAQNLRRSEPKHRLAPRISLSFPITDQGIIRFSYGHFYQNPGLSDVYRNPRFEDLDFLSVPSFGNPNLEPERSIQYEMGLQQGFTEDLKLDLTVYYKDVSNLLQSRRVVAGEVAASKEFNVLTNISYANVKGFTVSLLQRKPRNSLFSASLDYTFQVAEGAFDNPLDFFIDTRSGRQTEQEFVPLFHDRSHVINSTLRLSKPRDWNASTVIKFWSGTPYTPTLPSNLAAVRFRENSARRPNNLTVDLRLEKMFSTGATTFALFAQVNNLLDLNNERFIHTTTGRSLTSLEEVTNPARFSVLRRRIQREPEIFFPERFLDTFYQREDWLSEPREIRVGLRIDYN